MNKHIKILVLFGFLLVFSKDVVAKNPISSYFSQWLDETKVEMAAGKLLVETLDKESKGKLIKASPTLDETLREIVKKLHRNNLPYKVLILENPVPGEIPFPGGTIVLTSGLLDVTKSQAELFFILARNAIYISQKHPMKVLKKEGLYSKILQVLKMRQTPEKEVQLRKILNHYVKVLVTVDQVKTDRESVLLAPDPALTRKAAIELLERLATTLWPVMPLDLGDIPARIQALSTMDLK